MRNGAGTCKEKWHKIDTRSSGGVPPETLKTEEKNKNPGALAGATGVNVQSVTVTDQDTSLAATLASRFPFLCDLREGRA